MATRAQVRGLIEQGYSYETAARELGIPAGRAFMIATGLPADGSDATPEELAEAPALPARPQRLVNPRSVDPTPKPRVLAWVKRRAERDLKGGA